MAYDTVDCEVILPVGDDIEQVGICVEALRRSTATHVVLVARSDDRILVDHVWSLARERLLPSVQVSIVRAPGTDLASAVQRGLEAAQGSHVLVLDRRAVLPPGALQRLRYCLDSSDAVAVSPLTTRPGPTGVALPRGLSYRQLAMLIAAVGVQTCARLEQLPARCLLATRDALADAEMKDEAHVTVKGRATLDDATFVLTDPAVADRRELPDPEAPHPTLEARILAHDPHQPPTRLHRAREKTSRQLGRLVPRWIRGPWVPPHRLPPQEVPTHATQSPAEWQQVSARVHRRRWRAGRRRNPSVVYLLPGLGPYGGVLSVLQLVNRLLVRDVEATVATAGRIDWPVWREPMLFNPARFTDWARLRASMPRHDLVIATRWDTVYDALLLADQWGCGAVSFVQDYEPDVEEPGSVEREAAEASLRLMEHKIVKSDWLRGRITAFGGTVHRLPLGLDRSVFHPAGRRPHERRRIVSPARPLVAHRNLDGTVAILRALQRRRPDLLPTFYGKAFSVDDLVHEHLGILDQRGVARLLRDSAALIDASLFQGFGRPGLEAMACGVPAVLTTQGGINEYAHHDRNCLQADPTDLAGFVEAVLRVLDDASLRGRLVAHGLHTAAGFCAEREADRTAELFHRLLR